MTSHPSNRSRAGNAELKSGGCRAAVKKYMVLNSRRGIGKNSHDCMLLILQTTRQAFLCSQRAKAKSNIGDAISKSWYVMDRAGPSYVQDKQAGGGHAGHANMQCSVHSSLHVAEVGPGPAALPQPGLPCCWSNSLKEEGCGSKASSCAVVWLGLYVACGMRCGGQHPHLQGWHGNERSKWQQATQQAALNTTCAAHNGP